MNRYLLVLMSQSKVTAPYSLYLLSRVFALQEVLFTAPAPDIVQKRINGVLNYYMLILQALYRHPT